MSTAPDHTKRQTSIVASAEVFFSPGNDCRSRIIEILRSSERTADICIFTIADDRISDVILETHRRGIKVRIITDDMKVADDGSDIRWLRRSEIPVATDGPLALMHHKFAVIDQKAVIAGSYNWTRAAARANMEDLLIIRDQEVVAAYARRFERLWEEMGGARIRP